MRPARGYCDYGRARTDCEIAFGDDAPLYPVGARHPRDDMRGVSLRWLMGSFLTGVSSVMLMGGALYSANDSRTNFAATPQIMFAAVAPDVPGADQGAGKGDRLVVRTAFRPVAKEMMEIETSAHVGDREYIAVKPFLRLTTGLAMSRTDLTADLQPFDPLSVYSQSNRDADVPVSRVEDPTSLIEAASLVMSPLNDALLDEADEIDEAEESRETAEVLAQVRQVAAFAGASRPATGNANAFAPLMPVSLGLDTPFDPLNQFGPTELDAYAAIVRPGPAENVTAVSKSGAVHDGAVEDETRILEARTGDTVRSILVSDGIAPLDARLADAALELGSLRAGDQIEVVLAPASGIAFEPEDVLSRVSAFRKGAHIGTVLASEAGAFLAVGEPEDVELAAPTSAKAGGTQLYASLYETTLKHGLPRDLAEELVGIFTFDVNFRATVSPSDALNVFYEVDPDTREPSDIVHAALTVGDATHRYYRFRLEDGSHAYFDEDGRSAQKFLMRKPIAKGRFRSPFGMRRHPILRRSRMHNGVDYSAPRGTPIFAAGNGTVAHAKWAGGYGKQVALRHANGYETTYSHMTRYAAGIGPGARVRQGQVIGYVGSTGLSTGPHLHYEVHVNSRPVDPMRIKVPRTHELSGDQLAAFQREKTRIDRLMTPDTRIAELAGR